MSGGIRMSEIMGRIPLMRRIAHDPRNFIDCAVDPPESIYTKVGWVPKLVDRSEEEGGPIEKWVEAPLKDHLRFTVKEGEHWETKLTFCYSVDIVVLRRRVARLQSLSIQMSLPGHHQRGELNLAHSDFMAQLEPIVVLFFPLAPKVAHRVDAKDPIPISREGHGNVVYRTPVVFSFFVDHEDPERLFREQVQQQPRKKVQLYGPRGEKL